MAMTPKRILRRLRRRIRSKRPTESAEVGQRRLSDGTVLERCIWMNRQEIEQTTSPSGRAQLLIHWRSDESACVQDLPDLREIHLFWAHHVDYVAICWDRVSENPPTPPEVAATVDAWHRDYGLTWESVIFDGQGGALQGVHFDAEAAFPQMILVDGNGEVVFRRNGAFASGEHIQLRQWLRKVCG